MAGGVIAGVARQIFDVFVPKQKMLYLHPPIPDRYVAIGLEKVVTWSLDSGRWLVIAKTAVQGYGGNGGLADCRLKVVGTEADYSSSDESYGAPSALLGATITVLLPFTVKSSAQFYLQLGVQGPNSATFQHIVVTAIRDSG